MRFTTSLIVITLLGMIGCSSTGRLDGRGAGPQAPVQSLSVLGIGNSFTWNATAYLRQIAKAGGKDLTLGIAGLGGAPLDRHAGIARQFATDPTNPAGRPYPASQLPGYPVEAGQDPEEVKVSLREALSYRSWDVVTIQQVSTKSFDPETYEPYASELIDLILDTNPDAQIYIHQTWAYRSDSDRLENWQMTQQEMHDGIVDAYNIVAARYDLPQLPVGDAFALAREKSMWSYEKDETFNPETALEDELPDQSGSLINGYQWVRRGGTGERFLRFDSIHANPAGRYLGGCVWYETLFHVDARRITFTPEALTAKQAKSLRKIAHQAVKQEAAFSAEAAR